MTERRRAQARVYRREVEERNRRAHERESLAEQARDERRRAGQLVDRAGKLDPPSDTEAGRAR
jgi:hypothetical protein